MTITLGHTPNRLWIWKPNLNKSRVSQEDLYNSDIYKYFDLLVLQEQYIDCYGNTKATINWRVVYPIFILCDHPIWVVMLIRATLDTNSWEQLSIPRTGDV